MAIGEGFGQLISTGGRTALASDARIGRENIGDIISNVGQIAENYAKPKLMQRAAEEGAAAGDTGQIQTNYSIVRDAQEAYQSAALTAAYARSNIVRDDTIGALAEEHIANPEGFLTASQEALRKAIDETPPQIATRVEQSWARQIQRNYDRLSRQRQMREIEENRSATRARVGSLEGNIAALAARGELDSSEAMDAMAEYHSLQTEMVNNPLFSYSSEQRDVAVRSFAGRLAAIEIGRNAETQLRTSVAGGETVVGAIAAGRQAIQDAFKNDPRLMSLPPTEQERILREADNAFNQTATILREERRAADEERRTAEREVRERQSANYQSVLARADTEQMTMREIADLESRNEINAMQADSLRSNLRAATSRRQTEERRASAMQRAAERTAAAAERQARAEQQRNARETARDATSDLSELAERDPSAALRQARNLRRNGVITNEQLQRIESSASSEFRRQDSSILSTARSRIGRATGNNSRIAERFNDDYDAWRSRNPNATYEQVQAFADNYAGRVAQQSAASRGGGRARTEAEITAEMRRVTNGVSPNRRTAEQRRRLAELSRELVAVRQQHGRN